MRRWTIAESEQVIFLAGKGFNAYDIARAIGRNPSSVYAKARKFGTELAFRVKRYPMPAGDREGWDEAQKLCGFANVPMPLAQMVVAECHKRNFDLKTIRSESRLGEHVRCRSEIAIIARSTGYSLPVIGRALNRDHTTIIHALRSTEKAKPVDKSIVSYLAEAA